MEDTMEIKRNFFSSMFFKKIPRNTSPFVVKDKFQVYLNWCAEVKIAYINEDFKKWFFEKRRYLAAAAFKRTGGRRAGERYGQ